MVRIPEITQNIKPSPIRAFGKKIQKAIEDFGSERVLRFDIGDTDIYPEFDYSKIKESDLKYTASAGYEELRKLIASEYKKHGVSFQEGCESFFDPFLKTVDASRHFEGRDAVIGYSKKSQLLFVVYREQKDTFRMISARKATSQERGHYENL